MVGVSPQTLQRNEGEPPAELLMVYISITLSGVRLPSETAEKGNSPKLLHFGFLQKLAFTPLTSKGKRTFLLSDNIFPEIKIPVSFH